MLCVPGHHYAFLHSGDSAIISEVAQQELLVWVLHMARGQKLALLPVL